MAVAFVRTHTGVSIKTAGTTNINVNISTATTAGNTLVAYILFDNFTTASKPIVSSIAKMAGETSNWVLLGAARSTSTSGGAFASGEIWAIQTTVDWSVATYTVTLDSSVTMKATITQEFSGATAVQRSTAGTAYSTTTTAASAATTGTTPVTGDLTVGFIFGSNVAAVQAGDTDTTGGSWSAMAGVGSTGSSAATNNFGGAQYKILTGANAQTLNNSAAMTAGNGAIVAILQQYAPAITQKSYRIYADGTETGSTALAAQDTSYTADVTAGDVNLQVRTLLQTATSDVVGSDDFQLQWEKNSSGTWTSLAADTVIGYNSANLTDAAATTNRLTGGTGSFVAGKVSEDGLVDNLGWTTSQFTELLYSVTLKQAALANSDTLRFRVLRNGSPTGFTYTQTPTISITKIVPAITQAAYRFYADGTETGSTALAAQDTSYTADITSGDVNLQLRTLLQLTTGNAAPSTDDFQLQWEKNTSGTWVSIAADTVIGYNSSNLTDAAATTNRLTGGTGSFVAGKVSEDGLVDNLGWTGNNYTELLYSLTLKNANLSNGDTLRFRVLRNGATTELTYTSTPTLSIYAAVPSVRSRASGSSGTSDTTSHPITMPAGIQVGDLILVLFASDGNPTFTGTTTNHWYEMYKVDASLAVNFTIFYKFATGSDSLTVVTNTSEQSSHLSFCISNAAAPVVESTTGSGTNSTLLPVVYPYITTGVNTLFIVGRGGDSTVVATAAPSGYSNFQTLAAGGTNGASVNSAEKTVIAAFSESPGPFTSATEQWVTHVIGIPRAHASITTLSDDFTTLNTSTWGTSHSTGTAPVVTSGQLVCASTTGASESRMETKLAYDMTGAAITVEVPDVGNQALASLEYCPIRLFPLTAYDVYVDVLIANGDISLRSYYSSILVVRATTYSATRFRFIRLRESGGMVFCEFSSDGSEWDEFAAVTPGARGFAMPSMPSTWSPKCVVVGIGLKTTATEGSTTTATLDNLTTASVSTVPYPVVKTTAQGNSGASNVTSHPITLPSGLVTGDMLLVFFTVPLGTTVTCNIAGSSAAGWTNERVNSYASAITTAVFWKIVDASNQLTITTNTATQSSHVSYRVSGANNLYAHASTTGGSTTYQPPDFAYITSGSFSLSIPLFLVVRGGTGTSSPTSFPTGFLNPITEGGSGSGGANLSTAQQVTGTYNVEGGIFNFPTSSSAGFTVAIYYQRAVSAANSITDDFTVLNAARWNIEKPGSNPVPRPTVTGGKVVFPVNNSEVGIWNNIFATKDLYNLVGGSVCAEVDIGTTQSDAGITVIALRVTLVNFSSNLIPGAWIRVINNLLECRYLNISGGTTVSVHSVAYNATNHKWFKISESGGTIYWWLSADGVTWTPAGNATPNLSAGELDVSAIIASIEMQSTGTPTVNTTITADNFNNPPVAPADCTIREFAFYAEGTESGSTIIGGQGSNITSDVSAGNVNLQLRFLVTSDSTTAVSSSANWQLQAAKGSPGVDPPPQTSVTTSSTYVVGYNSASLTDGAATSARMTGGIGSFTAGQVSEDGLVDNHGWPGNNYTELVFSISLKQLDLADKDFLYFYLSCSGVNLGQWVNPRIDIVNIPAITQDAYRFYADGTEVGSVALAAQDTGYVPDLSTADAKLLLRVRLQLTNSWVPSDNTFQLQYEKNASGLWNNVGILDSYTSSGTDMGVAALNQIGQSFLGDGNALVSSSFLLSKQGAPTGNLTGYLWALSGTFGSPSSLPTGSPLATSTNVVAMPSLTTTPTWKTFTFDGTFTLVSGTAYFIGWACDSGADGSNLPVFQGNTAMTHAGTVAYGPVGGTWFYYSYDMLFKVATGVGLGMQFDSTNLTDGAATTNRLTGGSGSFIAGKISETGLVSSLGWTPGNFTEVLYALTIPKNAFVNGDVIKFRVLRNASPNGLTHSKSPNLGGGAAVSARLRNIYVPNAATLRSFIR